MEIKELCKKLRLAYIPDVYEEVMFQDKEQYLKELLKQEIKQREQQKIQKNITKAGFISKKYLEDYEWNSGIHIPRSTDINDLQNLGFIDRKENVICIGSPGTGKSHLINALGLKACENGYEARFFRVYDLVQKLEKLWETRKLESFKKSISKVSVIILDEMGYIPFNKKGAELLFQFVTDWYETKTVMISSNLEFSQWNKIFIDPRLTAALVDRLIHHAHIISFTGKSYRVEHALSKRK